VHFHLLPRKLKGDRFSEGKNDEVYPALEKHEGDLPSLLSAQGEGSQHRIGGGGASEPLKVDADENRKPRSMDEMVEEANWLRTFFEQRDMI
jgi:bis(5'-adenosyl)-triphosphatase